MAWTLPGLATLGAPGNPDPSQLADAALKSVPEGVRQDVKTAAATLGPGVEQLLCSPYSARVTAWGVSEGLRFVHHELRCAPPLGEEQLPELEVWDSSRPQPRWRDGVLLVPKYFSAFLDAPLPTFDPNHRAKWRTHEILHRLVGFFWRPDMSRFEAYLGARLGELLPVVHWYGLDEIGRVRCPEHRRGRPGRDWCPTCESGLRPYWEQQPDRSAAAEHAAAALEHWSTELQACREELETGTIRSTPRIGLDASSDAVGYLRGHWNRLTSWSFGAWVERFARPGVDHFDSNRDFLEHVHRCWQRLVFAPIEVDVEAGRVQSRRRRLADLSYRALCLVELADDDALEDAVVPTVDEAAALARRESISAQDVESYRDALVEQLSRHVGVDNANAVTSIAVFGTVASPASIRQIETGLRSALPRSLAGISEETLLTWARLFADDPSAWSPGPVATRFARFATECDPVPPDIAQRIAFEGWLLDRPHVDEEAERFAVLPAEGQPGSVRLNRTVRVGRFDAQAVRAVLDDFDAHGEIDVVAVHFAGEPRVIEHGTDVAAVFDQARAGKWDPDDATTGILLDRGFLVFFPPVR